MLNYFYPILMGESKQIDRQSSQSTTENDGVSTFTVKSPDLIGNAQWTLLFNGKTIRARIYVQKKPNWFHKKRVKLVFGWDWEGKE